MFVLILIIIGIASRLLPHVSQFTAVLAVAFFGGLYLPRWQALLVPVIVMAATDLILGFHDTMFFTWGSMLLISALGLGLAGQRNFKTVSGGSVASALVFFLITNFGAWLSFYPHTWSGLQECFFLAIPFFRTTLLSTVVYSLVLFTGYEWLLKRSQGTALARLL